MCVIEISMAVLSSLAGVALINSFSVDLKINYYQIDYDDQCCCHRQKYSCYCLYCNGVNQIKISKILGYSTMAKLSAIMVLQQVAIKIKKLMIILKVIILGYWMLSVVVAVGIQWCLFGYASAMVIDSLHLLKATQQARMKQIQLDVSYQLSGA